MSWTESEKLNEWLLRAYENGRREERERIIQLIQNFDEEYENKDCHHVKYEKFSMDEIIDLIKGETDA